MSKIAESCAAVSAGHTADRVERFGRRWKMEYVGMASVFAILFGFFVSELMAWQQALAATAGTFFLFMGLKKKTRDHMCASFLLFAIAAAAHDGIVQGGWVLPFLFFGVCVWALEGYLEKRPRRIYTLPAVLAVWAWVSPSWIAGLLFSAAYLAEPRSERPRLRRRLGILVASGGLAAGVVFLARSGLPTLLGESRLPLARVDLVFLVALGLPTLLSLLAGWRSLAAPHRINAIAFGLLAPWDLRAMSVFAIAASVALAASVLRDSARSLRWTAFCRRAEWYFFWVVLIVALGGAARYLL